MLAREVATNISHQSKILKRIMSISKKRMVLHMENAATLIRKISLSISQLKAMVKRTLQKVAGQYKATQTTIPLIG